MTLNPPQLQNLFYAAPLSRRLNISPQHPFPNVSQSCRASPNIACGAWLAAQERPPERGKCTKHRGERVSEHVRRRIQEKFEINTASQQIHKTESATCNKNPSGWYR